MLKSNRFAVLISLVGIGLSAIAEAQTVAEGSSSRTSEKKTSKQTIAVFKLDRPILETPTSEDVFLTGGRGQPLTDLIRRLEEARDDEQVACVAVMMGNAPMGAAQLQEVYDALSKIRESGKPVYFYADSLSFGALALASAANRISVAPVGDVIVLGLYGEQPYLRGLLNKIKVKPDFSTCGAYKSAAELFMRKGPSPEASEMYDWLFDSIFDSFVQMIADGRGKSKEDVRAWLDHGIYSAERAVKLGIIDAAEVQAEFESHLRKDFGDKVDLNTSYGEKKKSKIDLSNPFAFVKIWADLLQDRTKTSSQDAVGIVYVEGPIIPGSPEPSPFGSQGVAYSDPIRKALDKAAEDDAIKAVVLRVDSPGGSAVASEIILQATKRLAEKKPFVVSMGNVAGSGGYYVSCGTDTIFADESTITASIGVVTGKLATRKMWKSLGINWHPNARGKNAGMLASADTFTDEQRELMQQFMEDVYETFKGHVIAARGDRLKKPLEELAGGRVFTGRQALDFGLIDRLGTLNDAIAYAAERADLEEDEYEIRVIPKPKNFMEQLMEELSGSKEDEGVIRTTARASWQTESVAAAALPMLNRLQPNRAAAIRRALIQLELLQRETTIVAAPELVFDF